MGSAGRRRVFNLYGVAVNILHVKLAPTAGAGICMIDREDAMLAKMLVSRKLHTTRGLP